MNRELFLDFIKGFRVQKISHLNTSLLYIYGETRNNIEIDFYIKPNDTEKVVYKLKKVLEQELELA